MYPFFNKFKVKFYYLLNGALKTQIMETYHFDAIDELVKDFVTRFSIAEKNQLYYEVYSLIDVKVYHAEDFENV